MRNISDESYSPPVETGENVTIPIHDVERSKGLF
jgi:predicted RNA-binding protein with TRAM domain